MARSPSPSSHVTKPPWPPTAARAKTAGSDRAPRAALGHPSQPPRSEAVRLAAACQAYRRAEVGDGHRLPTAGEVRLRGMRLVEGLDRKAWQIRAVLDAKPVRPAPTPERSVALVTAARDLAEAMRIDNGPPKRGGMTDQEIREAWALDEAVRRSQPDPRPLPKLSAKYRRRLGLAPSSPEHEAVSFGNEDAA